jgi:succinate dehydrogenase (ubiquinone) cytochrome b560 subunit
LSLSLTSVLISIGFYIGALSYLTLPAMGYNFDSAAVISSVAAMPLVAKVGLKATIAFPFVFHCLNGIRHLVSVPRYINIYFAHALGTDIIARFGILDVS